MRDLKQESGFNVTLSNEKSLDNSDLSNCMPLNNTVKQPNIT